LLYQKKFKNDFRYHQADASNPETMAILFEDILSLYGLVNNAGILGTDSSHGGRAPASYHRMIDAHVKSALVLTELAVSRMRSGSAIVNIGSIETKMAAPDIVLYATAKGALQGMTIAYTVELASKGIRVNMISPGNVNTLRNKAQYVATPELIRAFEARTPLGRSVEPNEVADLTLFLLSNKSGAITGQNHIIDAGYTRALWDPGWK